MRAMIRQVQYIALLGVLLLVPRVSWAEEPSCDIAGMTLHPILCNLVQMDSSGSPIEHVATDLKIYQRNRAPFSCRMLQDILHQQSTLALPRKLTWQPNDAIELGSAYKAAFSREAQKSLAIAAITITPRPSCNPGERTTFLVWSPTNMSTIEGTETCKEIKILQILRLADICSGAINVMALDGLDTLGDLQSRNPQSIHVRLSALKMNPDGEIGLFASGALYRNRRTDINDRPH